MNNSRKFVLSGIMLTVTISVAFSAVYADGISNLLRDTGFVGIGTTTPTAELEVIGDVKISGSLISDGDICIGNCADTTPPMITITGDNPQTIHLGSGYTELGATTNDGSPVTIDASEFQDAVGTYLIYYDSADDAGNQAVQVTRTVNVVDNTPSDTPILHDTFDGSTDNWQYYGIAGYSASHDSEHGGSIHLSGNSFAHPYTLQGIQKTVNISGVSDSLVLSLDYRAKSNFAGSSVTNARLAVYDGTSDELLYSNNLAWAVGTKDTGWKSFQQDILSQVQGHDSITIKLYLVDVWSTNWNQQNWYDNIKLE